MPQRHAVAMSELEVESFLTHNGTLICATNGADGYPHLMPLWYVVLQGELWSWTYARSQKVRNLERDPRATLQVEDGTDYRTLRGVMLRCEVELSRDPDRVRAVGLAISRRHVGDGSPPGESPVEAISRQVPRRVALRFVETARVSWDHRKLSAGADRSAPGGA
jgi:nitroimidazol reductase NimA-like FMN-containing flavoprotein (pyridoxamine 5'-phosphate oxidase superfamily)